MIQPQDTPIVVCWTTVGDQGQADELAKELIRNSLAACVQIDQIKSHYCWDGKECADTESRLMIKTSKAAADKLMTHLQEFHSYDQPQIVMVESSWVDKGYANWVREMTKNRAK